MERGVMIKQMDMESFEIVMEMSMRAIGRTIKPLELELTLNTTAPPIKANGMTTSGMGTGLKNGPTDPHILETSN